MRGLGRDKISALILKTLPFLTAFEFLKTSFGSLLSALSDKIMTSGFNAKAASLLSFG